VTTDLKGLMAAHGLEASSWGNGPGERYPAHRHGYDKVIVAARGSIVFGLAEQGTSIDLRAGDRLDLPAGTLHDALVGPEGVACLEAHVLAGTLPPEPGHVRGWSTSETAVRPGA
jgi:quercetin dioxygenase-like cupin family protein